jgi:hypothetical protein
LKGFNKTNDNHRNQINLEEEINRNMKGKFKLLGHIGLALFLVSALVLTLAPVAQAATAVTNVWVQFTTSTYNKTDTATDFTIHFTPTTAMKRGVDTITVWFPDGSTAMGPAAFSLASAETTAGYYEVDANGEATGAAVECTSAAALSLTGYRITVITPVNLAAGTPCSLRVEDDADVRCANDTSHSPYKLKVYTSKDTTPVLSDAFDIDATDPAELTLDVAPATAGSAGQYTFTLDLDNDVAVGGTVTIIFPYETTIPSSIAADMVRVSNDSGGTYESCTVDPTVNQKAHTVTITLPVALEADAAPNRIRFSTGAGIVNPTVAKTYTEYYAATSVDEQFALETGGFAITANTATKLGFNNDTLPATSYSDSATMINMYSDILYLELQDQYGNVVDLTGTEPTVTLSTSSGTGVFYNTSYALISSILLDAGMASVHYRDSAAGTVTLTASHASYASGTWTMTIAPGVGLYDSSDNLIATYAPSSTNTDINEHAAGYHGGDYINDAITAAVAGDTVKLGDGIYELDTLITLNKKVTLTSVNGASSTILKPTTDALDAVKVTTDGTAANPIIIDGLTFTRLRSGTEFDQGVYNNGYDYVTVRNCVFDYVIPANEADYEYGAVVGFILHPQENASAGTITSATISNNTFTNCCPFVAPAGEAAVINIMTKASAAASSSITGVTISGNTMTNCNGINININGYYGLGTVNTATECYITANVTDNTITNPTIGIDIQRQTHSVNVLRNTVTGAYNAALYVETYDSGDPEDLVVKNNTFTGCAGADKTYFSSMSGAVVIEADAGVAGTDPVYQYNAIYDNDADYSIYVATSGLGAQDCKYNWYGYASGPYYSALTGATIAKSNTGGAGKKVSDQVTYYPWLHKPLTDVVADNASYQACTMSLVSGWNTLSTPVKLISTADSIDELIPSGMTIGYYYDATGWHQITTGYTLNACNAVYVKMSAATDVLLKFDAGAWTMPSKALSAGWNLISLAALDSDGKLADVAVASVYQTAAGLPGYSQVISPSLNATQYDMYWNAGTGWSYSSGQTAAADSMYVGLGYWIYMQNAATLAGFEITPIAPDLD